MAKIRYQFNTKSLKIEKVQVTMKERLKRLAGSMAFGLVFGVATRKSFAERVRAV